MDTAREAREGQLATIAHSRGAQLATAKSLITAAIDQFITTAEHPAADAG